MQNPDFQTPSNAAPTPPKKSKGKFLALGCGVPLLGLVLLMIIGSLFGGDTRQSGSQTAGTDSGTGSGTGAGKTGDDKSSDSSAALAAYMGKWQGQDGTSIWIRNGKGDYDGGNVKVQGGGVTLDAQAKTLKISSFFGIGKEWKINEAPHESGGQTEMKLSGVVYRRRGGFTPGAASDTTPSDTDKVPSQKELRLLAQNTILDFNSALQKRDFSGFHRGISDLWREQITAQQLRETFQSFIDKKANLAAVKTIKPVFTPAPHLDSDGALLLQGYYPSGANRLNFKLRYVPEDGAWKLLAISLNFNKA